MIIWCQGCNTIPMEMGPGKEIGEPADAFHHQHYLRPLCVFCMAARLALNSVSELVTGQTLYQYPEYFGEPPNPYTLSAAPTTFRRR